MKLNSIAEEAAACRKAFKGFKVGEFVLHCHHEILCEPLTESAESRISYIMAQKPRHERALRLHLFRPVKRKTILKFAKKDPRINKAYAEWEKAYAKCKKADAKWEKADAEWEKAYAEWDKANAELKKADAELDKLIHAKFCVKDCPWNGKTIFP